MEAAIKTLTMECEMDGRMTVLEAITSSKPFPDPMGEEFNDVLSDYEPGIVAPLMEFASKWIRNPLSTEDVIIRTRRAFQDLPKKDRALLLEHYSVMDLIAVTAIIRYIVDVTKKKMVWRILHE
jgi:hypothetical protein